MTPSEIQNVMYDTVQPYDVIQAVLQQEVVLYCGRLIATNPDIFRGILKVKPCCSKFAVKLIHTFVLDPCWLGVGSNASLLKHYGR
jgi:hypothetical protein